MNTELQNNVADLFRNAGREHHKAFVAVDGEDPEWPIWYAEYLQASLADALQTPFTKSQLVYCVMDADFEHAVRDPDSSWPQFYAAQFMERYASSPVPEQDRLVLYHSNSCPFCVYVTSAISRLGLEVELREIYSDTRYRDELLAARGRGTVPVLRIISPDGSDRWMPESQDIVRYLESITNSDQ